MRPLLLVLLACMFLAGCNQSSTDKPDAERVIKDTVTQILLQSFDEAPRQEGELVKVFTDEGNTPRMASGDLQQFMAQLKIPAQHFTVNNTADNEIKAQQGTRITLKANSFIDDKGNAVTTPVDVEVKECYHASDMLREYLGSNHQQMLESRGLVYVQAYSKGKMVQLKQGNAIQVAFPFAVNKAGYSFYNTPVLNTANNKWVALNQTQNPGLKNALPALPGKLSAEKPEFDYGGLGLPDYLQQVVHYPDYAKANELSAKVDAVIKIDENGNVVGAAVNSDYVVFKEEITRILNHLPNWKPARLNDANIASAVKISFDFNLRRSNQVLVEINPSDITYMPGTGQGQVASVATNNAYTRSFTGMGWFNYCRKGATSRPGADIVVQADTHTDVRIIGKNGKSLITGENCIGYSRFRNLPLNTEVKVLCIKYEKGQAYYAVHPLKLQQQNVVVPQWKATNQQELTSLFKALASV